LAIAISTEDPFYNQSSIDQTCMDFSRSEAWCEDNEGKREQFNAITAYLDSSNVYGSDDVTAANLRTFINGKLKVSDNNLLPLNENGEHIAGDTRAREMMGKL